MPLTFKLQLERLENACHAIKMWQTHCYFTNILGNKTAEPGKKNRKKKYMLFIHLAFTRRHIDLIEWGDNDTWSFGPCKPEQGWRTSTTNRSTTQGHKWRQRRQKKKRARSTVLVLCCVFWLIRKTCSYVHLSLNRIVSNDRYLEDVQSSKYIFLLKKGSQSANPDAM